MTAILLPQLRKWGTIMATKKTFEELLNRLETIVDEMESMDIGIEKQSSFIKKALKYQCSVLKNLKMLNNKLRF